MDRMKPVLLLLTLVFSAAGSAQHLDWVASGESVDMNLLFASADQKQNVVVVGEFRIAAEPNESFLVDGKGNRIDVPLNHSGRSYNNSFFHLVSYAADGEMKWHLEIQKENVEVHGISHAKNENILLFVHVSGQFTENGRNGETYDDDTHGWFPELYPSEEQVELWKAGYYVVQLSPNGKFINKTLLFDSQWDLEIEFDDFQSYMNDGYLIHGLADKRFDYPGVLKTPLTTNSGAHIVFAFDKGGKLLWSDIVRYQEGICVLYRSMASSPDGNVYLAGTSNRGMEFSNGEKVNLDPAQNSVQRQGYLLAYSPKGKIRWLKLSETNASVHQLKATNEQVFLSYLLSPGEVAAFGFRADTVGKKRLITSSFSSDGTNLWSLSEAGTRVHDLEVNNNNLYIYAQQPLRKYFETVEDKQVVHFEYSYLSRYTTQGKFISSKVYPFNLKNENVNAFLFPFSDSNIYIAMNFWEGFRKKLWEKDVKFGDLTGWGLPGMIARLKPM